jgi:hypothetical protein
MPKVRRKTTTISSPKKKESPKEEVYCRKCMQTKLSTDFYQAVDKYLDSNGLMSICRDCMQEMLDRALLVEHSLDKAVLSLCRSLNVKYDERAIESIRNSMDNADKDGKKFDFTFGKYLNLLPRFSPRGEGAKFESRKSLDLTFEEPPIFVRGDVLDKENDGEETIEELEKFWGAGLDKEDYIYLEQEKSNWESSHKFETHAEIIILKEVCYQQNNIRKLRDAGSKSVATEVKQLQELMKIGDMSPSSQNAAASGKNLEAFGMWVKDIERDTPAEFYKDKEKFKDIDGIEPYAEKYITRPLRNFITGSRDFNIDDISDSSEEDDED